MSYYNIITQIIPLYPIQPYGWINFLINKNKFILL